MPNGADTTTTVEIREGCRGRGDRRRRLVSLERQAAANFVYNGIMCAKSLLSMFNK